jgi:DNA-binding FadR family transcriptional regulator
MDEAAMATGSNSAPVDPARELAALASTPRASGRRLRGAVANYLGSAIVSGRIRPGETLTGEVANAEALNVSRSAYREAVQVLTAKGLVESRPKTGTRVLPRSHWNLLDPMVLAWAFTGEPDRHFVRDLFELRTVVEPAVARMAAERRSAAQLAAMENALDRMGRHTLSSEQGRAADREFHEAMLQAAGNEVMMTLAASIGAAVNWTTIFKHRTSGLPRDPLPDHALVFDAIAAGDGDGAARAMQALVDLAHEDTRLAMGSAAG